MFKRLSERIKQLTVMDIAYVKWSVFFTAIIIVKLFPKLLNINFFLLIVLAIACAARPFYKVWIKK